MTYTARLKVWRGDAAGGDLQDYDVDVNEGEVVLDIIHRLQSTQAGDLAVRWNCKAGKCGSCSAEVNGRPRLMCMTRMSVFAESDTITVTPLRAFPVVRDLVTDVSFNYAKAREIPAFAPPPGLAPGEYRMLQVDVERSQEFRKCIECFLCQNTCHVIRDHEGNKAAFAGPRYFIRLAELDMHPLDTRDRRHEAQERDGLGLCNITKCCTEVCPEHIKITDNAIIPMKERVVDRRYDPLMQVLARRSAGGAAGGAASTPASPADATAAESRARARLRERPEDRAALQALARALVAQGRFADASEATRRLAVPAATARPGPRSRAALADHARMLLWAVEAGQLTGPGVLAEARRTLEAAERQDGGGRTLVGLGALLAVTEGRDGEAERLLAECGSWQRGRADQADDELTRARHLVARGDAEGARAALDAARALSPDSPRLPHVSALLDAMVDAMAAPR